MITIHVSLINSEGAPSRGSCLPYASVRLDTLRRSDQPPSEVVLAFLRRVPDLLLGHPELLSAQPRES